MEKKYLELTFYRWNILYGFWLEITSWLGNIVAFFVTHSFLNEHLLTIGNVDIIATFFIPYIYNIRDKDRSRPRIIYIYIYTSFRSNYACDC